MTAAVADLLERAMARIATEETWCQGTSGRDEHGTPVDASLLEHATRFCAAGALEVLSDYYRNDHYDALRALDAAAAEMGVEPEIGGNDRLCMILNDTGAHFEVLEMYRRAIAAERATP